ncbi:hypothetical protein BKA93DRAFT_169524 [Sparassis latifolia]
MWRKFITVPSSDFLERFLPRPVGLTPGNYAGAFNKMPREGDREESLYEPFCKCLVALCPGYKCVSTANAPDRDEKFKQKVDAALFLEEEAPTDGRQHWAQQRISFEFKRYSGRDDPFDEEKEGYEHDTSYGDRTRGQAIAYAAEIFARQFRTFCFTVLILGNCARIVRWDRSGAAFTEKFNYKRNPEILGEFLWRFSHHQAKEQGYDESATLVTEGSEDHVLMKQYAETKLEFGDYIREYFKTSFDAGWPLWRLKVDDESSPEGDHGNDPGKSHVGTSARTASGVSTVPRSTYYLVGKPHFLANGMVGRGTRGVDHVDIEKEGDVLRKLNDASVKNVPTLVCHGDVLDQQTLTQAVWEEVNGPTPAARRPLKKHTHYRLVVKEVGYPLAEFKEGFELVKVVYDCLIAHQQAYEKLHLLHRDISVGNILMMEQEGEEVRVGYLCDWELSKLVSGGNVLQAARQPDRTGTWQFMSALSLRNPYKPSTLQDDLESFFHLLLYMAIRFLPHTISDVGSFIYHYFDASKSHQGQFYICGDKKWSTMKNGDLSDDGEPIEFGISSTYPLNSLLGTLLGYFKGYYAVVAQDLPYLLQRPKVGPASSNIITANLKRRPTYLPPTFQNEVASMNATKVTQAIEVQMKENREMAQQLNSHKRICGHFEEIIRSDSWLELDKTTDNLPKKYNLVKETEGVRDSTNRTSLGNVDVHGLSTKMMSLSLNCTPKMLPVASDAQERVCPPLLPQKPRSVAHSNPTESFHTDPHLSVLSLDMFGPTESDPVAQPPTPPQDHVSHSTNAKNAQSSPFWKRTWSCTVQ